MHARISKENEHLVAQRITATGKTAGAVINECLAKNLAGPVTKPEPVAPPRLLGPTGVRAGQVFVPPPEMNIPGTVMTLRRTHPKHPGQWWVKLPNGEEGVMPAILLARWERLPFQP